LGELARETALVIIASLFAETQSGFTQHTRQSRCRREMLGKTASADPGRPLYPRRFTCTGDLGFEAGDSAARSASELLGPMVSGSGAPDGVTWPEIFFSPPATVAHPSKKSAPAQAQHSAWGKRFRDSHASANGCDVAVAKQRGREAPAGAME